MRRSRASRVRREVRERVILRFSAVGVIWAKSCRTMSRTSTTNVLTAMKHSFSQFTSYRIVENKTRHVVAVGNVRRSRIERVVRKTRRCKLDHRCGAERVGGGRVVRGGNARRLPTRTRGQHGSRALSNSAIGGIKR